MSRLPRPHFPAEYNADTTGDSSAAAADSTAVAAPLTALFDPARCPLCGAGNGCCMADGPGADPGGGGESSPQASAGAPAAAGAPTFCWCAASDVEFSPALLAALPQAARGAACICRGCAGQLAPASAVAAARGPTTQAA